MITIGTDTTPNRINLAGYQTCNPPKDCIGCLSASALAQELTAAQVNMLCNRMEVRKLSKNEILISEGDYDGPLYVVAKGEFEVSRTGARGQENLAMLKLGAITGGLAFVDEGLKCTATVKAEHDDCCVIALGRRQLESLLSDDPSLVYKVMRAIVRSAHGIVGKMDSIYSDLMYYISG